MWIKLPTFDAWINGKLFESMTTRLPTFKPLFKSLRELSEAETRDLIVSTKNKEREWHSLYIFQLADSFTILLRYLSSNRSLLDLTVTRQSGSWIGQRWSCWPEVIFSRETNSVFCISKLDNPSSRVIFVQQWRTRIEWEVCRWHKFVESNGLFNCKTK